ncbi:MAG: ribbon-helix-helix protein, CopG family [Dehalococcoidia bacterium]|nr:ribbon-helix-helix protein, CopG family [Dehalococcoidia bacterium]
MPGTLQIRGIPEETLAELKRRAAARGKSLNGFVREMLEHELSRPDPEDVFARIRSRPPVSLDQPIAETIREEREAREAHLSRLLERD